MNSFFDRVGEVFDPSRNPFSQARNNDNIEETLVVEVYKNHILSTQSVTEEHLREIVDYLADNIPDDGYVEEDFDIIRSHTEVAWEYPPLGVTIYAERAKEDFVYNDEWSQGIARKEVECLRDVITVKCVVSEALEVPLEDVRKALNARMDRWNTYRNDTDRARWRQQHT